MREKDPRLTPQFNICEPFKLPPPMFPPSTHPSGHFLPPSVCLLTRTILLRGAAILRPRVIGDEPICHRISDGLINAPPPVISGSRSREVRAEYQPGTIRQRNQAGCPGDKYKREEMNPFRADFRPQALTESQWRRRP